MSNFEGTWETLTDRAEEIDVVETFKQGNKNDVKYDRQQGAISFYSRESSEDYWKDIPRESWKIVWNELRDEGELDPDTFRELTGIRRGSTAVPFLQEALDLPVSVEDRVVYLPESK